MVTIYSEDFETVKKEIEILADGDWEHLRGILKDILILAFYKSGK